MRFAPRRDLTAWLRLVKFSHTLFAMPFAVLSAVWAIHRGVTPTWHTLILIGLCMVSARNTAMAYNRYADRRWDALNPRTARREIPAGSIAPRAAMTFVVVNAVLFVFFAACLNLTALFLSPVALVLLLGYSRSKRFTALCHLWLGATLALAPLGAAVALKAQFGITEIVLAIGVACWVCGFDILYALQDERFDSMHQLHSIPARFGRRGAIRIARLAHVVALPALAATIILMRAGYIAWIGFALFTMLLAWQHTWYSARSIARIGPAFMLLNGFNSLLLAGLISADLLLSAHAAYE